MIIKSTHDETKEWISAFIVPKLLKSIPSHRVDRNHCEHIKTLPLADAQFHVPAGIDVLLGAEFYARAIRNGIRRQENQLTAQNTSFGWIVFGANNNKRPNVISSRLVAIDNYELMELLSRFWETENVPQTHFASTRGRGMRTNLPENDYKGSQWEIYRTHTLQPMLISRNGYTSTSCGQTNTVET